MKLASHACRRGFLAAFFVVVVLLPSAISFAQSSLSLRAGANLPWTETGSYLFEDYWPVGFNAAARVEIPVTGWLLLDPALAYRLYPHVGGRSTPSSDIPVWLSSGEPLQELWVGLGLRLQPPSDSHTVVPFVDIGAGYEFERIGRVTEDWGPGQFTRQSNPIYLRDWAYTAGAGLRILFSSRFSLEPSYLWHVSGRINNYGILSFDLIYAVPL